MESVTRFLEEKLKLRVNREKSAVAAVGERRFLGHRLLLNGKLGISSKSVNRAKEKIRQITRRNRGVSLAQVIVELNFVPRWMAYLLPLCGISQAARCFAVPRASCGLVRKGLVAIVPHPSVSSGHVRRLVRSSGPSVSGPQI